MIVRVAVEGIESTLDLEDDSWTPELIATFLRLCGDEVMRVCEGIGIKIGGDASDLEALLAQAEAMELLEGGDEAGEGTEDADETTATDS